MTKIKFCGSTEQYLIDGYKCNGLSKNDCETKWFYGASLKDPFTKKQIPTMKDNSYNCLWIPETLNTFGKCVPFQNAYPYETDKPVVVQKTNPCTCPQVPFTLDLFATESKAPVNCSDIKSENCDLWQNHEYINCIKNDEGPVIDSNYCSDPMENQAVCDNIPPYYEGYAAGDCGIGGFGSIDSCDKICADKYHWATSGEEVYSYPCTTYGYAKFCNCKPKPH